MSVIVVQRRRRGAAGFIVPAGGEILWYGSASQLPAGWEIDQAAFGNFVMGVNAGNATDSESGSNSHSHAYSSNTSHRGSHTHTYNVGQLTDASGSVEHYGSTSNAQVTDAWHRHDGVNGLTSGSGGAHSHSLNNTGSTTVLPPYRRLYWIKALVDVVCPVNGIVIWDKSYLERPDGFQVCNGSHGTPDLRDRFVYGASGDGDVGNSGGSTSHSHTNSNVNAAGGHTHFVQPYVSWEGGGPASNYGGTGSMAGPHDHQTSGNLTMDNDHTHSFGNTSTITTLPKFVRLYYLMRTE